jgi:hypothetical protein
VPIVEQGSAFTKHQDIVQIDVPAIRRPSAEVLNQYSLSRNTPLENGSTALSASKSGDSPSRGSSVYAPP